MPFTPFHFGPGAVVHVLAPRHVSFLAFCAANVLIDVEPLYFMLTDQYPLHRFFHTYVGASLVATATVVLFGVARRLARRFRLPNLFQWQALDLLPVALGALVGSYSHVVLDSLMHGDMAPLAPFNNANPLWQMVSIDALHATCVAAGVVALCVLGIRRLLRQRRTR